MTTVLQESTNPASAKVLIVDDLMDVRWALATIVRQQEMISIEAASGELALLRAQQDRPDLVLLDVGLPDLDGFEVLARIKAIDKAIPVVMITANGNTSDAVRAMRAGAFDYVAKPFSNQDVVLTMSRALREGAGKRQVRTLQQQPWLPDTLMNIMGHSVTVQEIQTEVDRIAKTNFSVLVTGDSGTGKELVSKAIHASSGRAAQPFVALDCGSIPDTLIESELFGHEKGAFTGAHQAKAGAFELAAGGTIFLDEIGNLPLAMQGKLLRALETRSIHRIGSTKDLAVDFRVVAATNADLRALVDKQLFRGDLYHRLSEYHINIPALCERPEDLVFLVERFLAQTNKELTKQVGGLSQAAWDLIYAHRWPGNARELRNQLRRAVLMCDEPDGIISPKHLMMICGAQDMVSASVPATMPAADTTGWSVKAVAGVSSHITDAADLLAAGMDLPLKQFSEGLVAQCERAILLEVLTLTQCNKARASRLLHIDYKTLLKKLKEHSISTSHLMSDVQ
jgi:DNA-binding NtrC family response regulator